MDISKGNYHKSNNRPTIAILSLQNSYSYGGVLSSLKVTYDFCQKYFDPTVLFLSFKPDLSTSLKRLKITSDSKSLNYFGMKCIEIGARWAFWEPGHYKFNLKQWEETLSKFDYFLAVSGTCICAHPLALLNKKFGMIISTLYNEDRERRVKELKGIRYLIDKISNPQMQKIESFILKKADFIWALSNYSKKNFETIIGHSSSKIIRCGHPIDCCSLPAVKQKDETIIISVGRFSDPRKNIEMLLRVFNKIYKFIPTAKLYIVGKKPENHRIQNFTKLPSFNNVIFTGQVSAGDLDMLYQQSSLMLLPSYQEGLGIVGLEALSYGIPIIATDCGGPSDYIINDITGYLVKINDIEDMASQALSILSSKEKLISMSKNAQKFISENYSTEKIEFLIKMGLLKMHPELKNIFNVKHQTANAL